MMTMPDLATDIAQLTEASKLEIERINKAALLHQADLMKQLEWSKEEQLANAEVCRIRLRREIEGMVLERLGKISAEGPIRKLPVELLSHIFHSYIGHNMSPWRLVKVCRSWMQTALATPQLWRHIRVRSALMHATPHEKWVVNGEQRISMGRMQVCSTVVQLRAALRRSGAVPLEINVDLPNNGIVTPSDLSLMRIILAGPVSERIEILDLATFPFLYHSPQLDISIGHFYHLKKIHLPTQIDQTWMRELLESLSRTSSRLKSLQLNCSLSPELANCSFWPLLNTLELRNLMEFNSISEKVLNLEEFPIGLARWPNSATPVTTWGKIRNARITCHPRYLDRAIVPNLESLVFRDVHYSREATDTMDIYSPISYPILTKLDVEALDIRWLSKLSLPSLTDLTITCTKYDAAAFPDGGTPIFNGHNLPAVTTLVLTTGWTGGALSDTIASFPNLSTLRVNPTQHKHQEFALGMLKRLDGTEQPLICPNLTHLSLGSPSEVIYTLKKNAGPLLKRLVTTRKKIGRPLQELSVFWWKNRHTSENYV